MDTRSSCRRMQCLLETETTELQRDTEDECLPFFQSASSVVDDDDGNNDNNMNRHRHSPSSSLVQHLESIGLLRDGKICLLYNQHSQYVSTPFQYINATNNKNKACLRSKFTSLDASRPWIMYWTLHSLDLMNDKLSSTLNDNVLLSCVNTLQACFSSTTKTTMTSNNYNDEHSSVDGNVTATAGGFGGGPGQMAHMATTYAAIMCLAIIATTTTANNSNSNPTTNTDSTTTTTTTTTTRSSQHAALDLLTKVRHPLRRFMVSLRHPNGGFAIHQNGEHDVRATYTVVAVATLLQLITCNNNDNDRCYSLLWDDDGKNRNNDGNSKKNDIIDFVVSCQTYEGGFGGEPGSEAHGGYTYCAVATLTILNALDKCNVTTLRQWLTARQQSYEGGFNGRSNKLVDGCYSFWQGATLAIVSRHLGNTNNNINTVDADNDQNEQPPLSSLLLFDEYMLQRYILLCAQDAVNGGLRDKPSKPRDFYHSCYNLSGLSVSQHYGALEYGHARQSRVAKTDLLYNIRVERVHAIQEYFASDDDDKPSIVVMEE